MSESFDELFERCMKINKRLIIDLDKLGKRHDKLLSACKALLAVRPIGKHDEEPCDCELCKATRQGQAAIADAESYK